MHELKLIPGKDYRMRNGQKAYFIGADPLGQNIFYHYDSVTRHSYNGTKWLARDSDYDIVAEWEEPKKPVVFWVNEYRDYAGKIFYGKIHNTEKNAKEYGLYDTYYIRTIKLQEVQE